MSREPDTAKWFDRLGSCMKTGCRSPAIGIVRGPHNESLGRYCGKHGGARVVAAQREREAKS